MQFLDFVLWDILKGMVGDWLKLNGAGVGPDIKC